jgi:ArsR family transcriptional regulator
MDHMVRLFKALSDETRIRIIKLLEHGELCVCDIVAALGMVQPKVSFHLGVLKNAGFLKDRKKGKWVHYSLDESEMFKRLLLMSVTERASGMEVEDDRARLKAFTENKKESGTVVSMSSKNIGCCQR